MFSFKKAIARALVNAGQQLEHFAAILRTTGNEIPSIAGV
jgi:hypothetical protein